MWQRLRKLTERDLDMLVAIVRAGRASASVAPDPKPVAPEADLLADDCEAFLAGRYVERLAASWRAIPEWAWLNSVAHGTVDELREVAAGSRWVGSASLGGTRVWCEATAYLAGELLAHTGDDPHALSRIQASALVPLELELASQGHDRRATAAQLVAIALASLAGHPSTHPKGAEQ